MTPLMKELIELARAEGFDDIGVCSTDTPLPDHDHIAAAFDEGRLAPFPWMERTRDQRLDPRVRMPSARSVVIVVQSYWQGDHDDVVDADQLARGAKVARYAWGQDYHHILRRKLRRLRKWLLERVPGAKVAPFNDVDAVTERAWAIACGLGFSGKSGMFISRRLGTWTFLGGLLTDIDLHGGTIPPRVTDACGTCTACLSACPTGAIIAPHVVDARRCLVTWNVEEPLAAEGEAWPGHGWAVGCDVCQEVCPWNKFAQPTREARYAPRHVVIDPEQPPAPTEVAGTPLARPGAQNLTHLARRARRSPSSR